MRKKHLIRSVVYEIADLWPEWEENLEKKEIMDYWVSRNKLICNSLLKLTIIGIIIYNGISLVIYLILQILHRDPDYVFAFAMYYPFEIDSMWKYLAVYLMQMLATTAIYEGSYQSCDMFLFSLTMNACMLFRLLQYDLVNITVEHRGPRADESLENLKNIVRRHQRILKLAGQIDEIFGAILFNVMVFSSLIICFFGFLSISSGVAEAAYGSQWYNSDLRFRKIIFIIIARSQKPCKLRAMGYADINFETFYKICGSTWSYLSVVNQMYQKTL
ncbi:odorant receptor 67a-like [Leguminivora glycinivorella]|uniref:odorant receptor 67a-like n=1 Tax=Leguminivora glycinivorella TaxID=1035111 RepID=UPI002010B584|nr:odorant receptor 67a-like [Leguminivora glycinivorella]